MTSYVALLRGINVGGKNVISMKSLIDCFSAAADSSKSRIDRLRSKRLSQRMTVRNWRTTNRLLEMLDAAD
jgi:uncharacterized protein (DUF1697 family)